MIRPLTVQEAVLRLLLACLFSGIIGLEREYNSRPAGIRTHLMVCIGATIMSLIQVSVIGEVWNIAQTNPIAVDTVRTDPVRLICQVITGVGFLGAGTIVTTKSSVRGLTTAASIWATAGLGLAIGMGYYIIATAGFVFMAFVLVLFKRVIRLPARKQIEIQYEHRIETRDFIIQYFESHSIQVEQADFSVNVLGDHRVYTNNYVIDLPKGITYSQIADDLCECKNIKKIALLNI